MIRAADSKRRARFVAYILHRWGDQAIQSERSDARADLQQTLGFESRGRLTQLLDPNEAFGERAGASAAERFGLAEDYFEHDHDYDSYPSRPPALNVAEPTVEDVFRDQERMQQAQKEMEQLLPLWTPLFAHQKKTLMDQLEKEYAQAQKIIEEMRDRASGVTSPLHSPADIVRPKNRSQPRGRSKQ